MIHIHNDSTEKKTILINKDTIYFDGQKVDIDVGIYIRGIKDELRLYPNRLYIRYFFP